MIAKSVLFGLAFAMLVLNVICPRSSLGQSASRQYGTVSQILRVHNLNTSLNYETIQAAISAPETLNKHIIFVDAGTYYGNVLVDKGISLIGENKTTTIIDANNTIEALTIIADNVSVSGFTVQHSFGNPGMAGGGLMVKGDNGNIQISDVIARENSADWGVHLTPSCHNITVANTLIENNPRGGLLLNAVWDVDVYNCTVSSNGNAIQLMNAENNSIHGNLIMGNGYAGININQAKNNHVFNNTLMNNIMGISMAYSTNNTFSNNQMTNNIVNFGMIGVSLLHFIHEIDSSNVVDGKPVCYLANMMDYEVPADVGLVAVVNSTGITVRDLNVSHNMQGVMFAFTSNSTIENVTAESNLVGISLFGCYNVSLLNNVASSNGAVYAGPMGGGITLSSCYNNTLLDNLASSNIGSGIVLIDSVNNTLRGNVMTNNTANFMAVPNAPIPTPEMFINDVDTSNLVDGKPIYYWVNQSNEHVPLNAGCVLIVNSNNITAEDLTLEKNGFGIILVFSTNSAVKNVTARGNLMGIAYGWCNDTLVENCEAVGNVQIGVLALFSSNGNLTGNRVSGNGYVNLQMGPGTGGLGVTFSNTTVIAGNILTNNSIGIHMSYSYENQVIQNNFTDNGRGILLNYSNNNDLIENRMLSNNDSIQLQWSPSNTLIGNNITSSNNCGLDITFSGGNVLRNNSLVNNVWNFGIWGDLPEEYVNDVDTSNTINGNPIVYVVNQTGATIDSSIFPQIGAIVVANSTGIAVRNLTLSDNFETLTFAYTNSSEIANVTITDSLVSILMHCANNTTLKGSTFRNNLVGPLLRRSNGNIVIGNSIINNTYGVYLYESSQNNQFVRNRVRDSYYGIFLSNSGGNTFYHNNFVNNTNQLRLQGSSGNTWDNGEEGNYWSSFSGVDLDHDGISETPYVIGVGNVDNHPLMGMFYAFEVIIEHGDKCQVEAICNSTIEDLTVGWFVNSSNQYIQPGQKFIQSYVRGDIATAGFCRITIPKAVLNGSYVVLLDWKDERPIEVTSENSTHVSLYYTYQHSAHEMIILSDTTPPTISIYSPENKSHGSHDVPLTLKVDGSVSWIGYSLDNQDNITITGNTTLNSLPDGTHRLVVYANDTMGNMAASNAIEFLVDTLPPNITSISQNPPKDNVQPQDQVRINATVIDYLSGVKQVTLNYTDGNGAWITVNMTNLQEIIWNATIPAFPNGTNITYVIIAEDKCGNIITSENLGYTREYPVIPEFVSVAILLLLGTATLSAVLIARRKRHMKQSGDYSLESTSFSTKLLTSFKLFFRSFFTRIKLNSAAFETSFNNPLESWRSPS